jgi:hypothetical protein
MNASRLNARLGSVNHYLFNIQKAVITKDELYVALECYSNIRTNFWWASLWRENSDKQYT